MKPIIFSTEMVRAILDGRKTQTRRVIKPQPPETMQRKDFLGFICSSKEQPGSYGDKKYWRYGAPWGDGPDLNTPFPDPPYHPGQILWVRETWQHNPCRGSGWPYDYKATPEHNSYEHDTWRPSIHMPREAARLFLRVKNVRVERLQEILCGDMRREGCIPPTVKGGQYQQWQRDYWIPLWDSLYAKRGHGWDTNPWVWVTEFSRTEEPKP